MSTIINRKTFLFSMVMLVLISAVIFIVLQVIKPSEKQKTETERIYRNTEILLTKEGYTQEDIKNIDVDYHYYPEFKMPIAFVEFTDEVGVVYIYFEYDGVFKQQPMIETTIEYRQKKNIEYTSEVNRDTLKHYEYRTKRETIGQ